MTRLWSEYRLLTSIVLFAIVIGSYEIATIDPTRSAADGGHGTLAELYPDSGRLLFAQGSATLAGGDAEAALPVLAAAYEAGFKEDERVYSGYIDALVRTRPDPERIAQVLERWKRDYPTSQSLEEMRGHLRRANLLQ